MYDVIIIGAGPAGLSGALYCSRAGLNTLILDAGAPGGKLNLTAEIENYPGYKEVAGPELAYEMFEHATKFGATYEYGQVQEIIDLKDHKKVICDEGEYEAKAVLIASGTKERKMNIPHEEEMTGRGVSYCAVCDGAFFTGEEVAVIGGGNSALEEAMYLTRFASHVHLIVRRDVFRADNIVQEKLKENDKIIVHFNQKPVDLQVNEQENKVSGLILEDTKTGEHSVLPIACVFPFIGLDPISEFASKLNITNEQGYIITDENMKTSCDGIYAAGDVRQKFLRQVVTATNDGAIAAQAIFHDCFE